MANVVTNYCQQAVGKPYVFAKPRPITTQIADSYDCSGLAACAWLCAGITITPYTVTMYGQVQHRPVAEARPGDLLFYEAAGYIYHVAINIGGGQLIEAPQPGENVHVRSWAITDKDLMGSVGALPDNVAGDPTIVGTPEEDTSNIATQSTGGLPDATSGISIGIIGVGLAVAVAGVGIVLLILFMSKHKGAIVEAAVAA